MKNFSDLQDIDSTCQLTIKLKPITNNGIPDCTITIGNHIVYNDTLTQELTISQGFDLLDVIPINVIMNNKHYSELYETAIVIESIEIDGINIIPDFNHLVQYDVYDNYTNQALETNYMGFNGSWTLDIAEPFYMWLHKATDQGWLFSPN